MRLGVIIPIVEARKLRFKEQVIHIAGGKTWTRTKVCLTPKGMVLTQVYVKLIECEQEKSLSGQALLFVIEHYEGAVSYVSSA